MAIDMTQLKSQILDILNHPEAEDGLYFRNFFLLHEEDERKALGATQLDTLAALTALIRDGRVKLGMNADEIIFELES